MYMYKTGDRCPCCGQPITKTDPDVLLLFSLLCAQLGLEPIEEDDADD